MNTTQIRVSAFPENSRLWTAFLQEANSIGLQAINTTVILIACLEEDNRLAAGLLPLETRQLRKALRKKVRPTHPKAPLNRQLPLTQTATNVVEQALENSTDHVEPIDILLVLTSDDCDCVASQIIKESLSDLARVHHTLLNMKK